MTQETTTEFTSPVSAQEAIAALQVTGITDKGVSNFARLLIESIARDPRMIPTAFDIAHYMTSLEVTQSQAHAFDVFAAGFKAFTRKYPVEDERDYDDAAAVIREREEDPLHAFLAQQVPLILDKALAAFGTNDENLLNEATDCAGFCLDFDPMRKTPSFAVQMIDVLLDTPSDSNYPFFLLEEMATEDPKIFTAALDHLKKRCLDYDNISGQLENLCLFLGRISPDRAKDVFNTIKEVSSVSSINKKEQRKNINSALSSVPFIVPRTSNDWRKEILPAALDLLGEHLIKEDEQNPYPIVASPFADTAVKGLKKLADDYRGEMDNDQVDVIVRRLVMLYAANPKRETTGAIETVTLSRGAQDRHAPAIRETIGTILEKSSVDQQANALGILNCRSCQSLTYSISNNIINDKLFDKITSCAISRNTEISAVAQSILSSQCTSLKRARKLISVGATAVEKGTDLDIIAGLGLIGLAGKHANAFPALRGDKKAKSILTSLLPTLTNDVLRGNAEQTLRLFDPPPPPPPAPKPEVKAEPTPPPRDPNAELNRLTQRLGNFVKG